MRFLMLVKATKESEAGVLPDEKLIATMGKYNEELQKAGALIELSGLKPSSAGARVTFASGKPMVIDGPFTETKEIIAGFWLIQVKSREEALEWARRIPFVDGEVELRPLYELEDFAPSEAVDRARELGAKLHQK
jgi:hypothetical protein